MLPKDKIKLARHLKAQTTPYPEVGRWLRRGLVLLIIVLIAGTYLVSRRGNGQTAGEPALEQQVLGEQDNPAEFQLYEVKTGDTLFSVSQNFSVDWQELANLNSLEEPYILKVGQELKIPR